MKHLKSFLILLVIVMCIFTNMICIGSAQSKYNLEIGASSMGSTLWARASSWASLINSNSDSVNLTVSATGGSIEQFKLVNAQELDIGFVMKAEIDQAKLGQGAVADADFSKLRGIWTWAQGVFQIVVLADSGINTFEDFKGKVMCPGPRGSMGEKLMNGLLNVAGLVTDKDYEIVSLTFTDAVEEMRDRTIDGLLVLSYPPQSAIMDLASSHPIRMIDVPDYVIDEFLDTPVGLGFSRGVFKKEWAYEGQVNVEDVDTIAARGVLTTHTGIPEDVIYEAVFHLFENMEIFYQGSPVNKSVSLETALDGMVIPLHLGAQRYYESKGIEIPEEMKSPEGM